MSKILNEKEIIKFKNKFLKDYDGEIFSIILSIKKTEVYCYINGETKLEFKKNEVEDFL